MLNVFKLFSLILLLASSLHFMDCFLMPILLLMALSLLFIKSGLSFSSLLKRNIFILLFTATFSFFAVVSHIISNNGSFITIAISAVKTVYIFNIVLLGSLWLGKNGFLFILNCCKSITLKLYLLLLYNLISGFSKRNQMILFQLQSRVQLKGATVFLFLRYYISNLLTMDLYSLHLNQGALLTRLHSDVSVYCRTDRITVHDGLIITISLCTGIYLLCSIINIFPGVA